MSEQVYLEKWQGEINVVKIGSRASEGGSRESVIEIGGEKTLPFLFKEGTIPHAPVIAHEIWDCPPVDWFDTIESFYGNSVNDPLLWAKTCVEKYNARILSLRLQGTHPDFGDKSPEQAAETVKKVLKAVKVPLILTGSGDDAKDNLVLTACSEACKGERCLIGSALQENYKTLVAAALADGHSLIAESPIDLNIAKQLNILISDMGLPLDRIVINPTIGALGYGIEYAYSIMERARLAALSGDKTVAVPFICFVGQEAWKTKEAKTTQSEMPAWGNEIERGILWETLTATMLLNAGANILVMRHPQAIQKVQTYIDSMMKGAV